MEQIKVLDHGYIQLIDTWGSDRSVIEAARMSTQKGFLGWGTQDKPGDERLLAYLYRHKHMTPFEFAGAVIELRAPIIVFREWHRHRTQSYNEASARYTPLPDVNYIPTAQRIINGAARAGANRQAQGTTPLQLDMIATWLSVLQESYDKAQSVYEMGLEIGIPKELARLAVPVGRYSTMRASASLRNWMQFLDLRAQPDAQEEIRVYAQWMIDILWKVFPHTLSIYTQARGM